MKRLYQIQILIYLPNTFSSVSQKVWTPSLAWLTTPKFFSEHNTTVYKYCIINLIIRQNSVKLKQNLNQIIRVFIKFLRGKEYYKQCKNLKKQFVKIILF